VLKIGAVVAEAYTFLQPEEYCYYLDYTKARVVVGDQVTLDKLRIARKRSATLHTILIAGSPDELSTGEVSLSEASAAASPELETAPTTRDDIGLWKFTTGSTGKPKAAVHCQHDPLISHEAYAQNVLQLTAEDVVLPVPKLFFGYARDLTALFPFAVGARGVVFPDRSTPSRLFDLIERHRPTILVQVPTMMRSMLAEPDAAQRDLSSVRIVVSSGETLPLELHRRWLDTFGVEVLEGVGSSELYHIYVSNRPGSTRPGSVGTMVPGYTGQLVDGDGAEVANGEPGELVVSGESAALMYWGDHEKSKQTFSGDTVRTGDVFVRSEDGYYTYRGRSDDLIKVGGIWVAPVEIEECLRSHPDVDEVAVVPYEEAGLLRARACVVASDPGLDLDSARAFVRARLAPHKAPDDLVLMSDMPKTASGKVDRAALRGSEASP